MKTSRIILGALVLSFFLSGTVEALWPFLSDATFFIHGFTIAFLVFWWVGEHASEQGLAAPPNGSKFLSAFIPPVGLPYYFYRGYGVKLGTVKLGLSILTFAFASALYLTPFYITYQITV